MSEILNSQHFAKQIPEKAHIRVLEGSLLYRILETEFLYLDR
jgi:hypothetical protein